MAATAMEAAKTQPFMLADMWSAWQEFATKGVSEKVLRSTIRYGCYTDLHNGMPTMKPVHQDVQTDTLC